MPFYFRIGILLTHLISKFGAFKTSIMVDHIQRLKAKEFQAKFYDEQSCLSYLSEFKWGNGYSCPRCGNTKYCAGGREFSRQCTSCHLTSSAASGTLFHNVKFPLLKAFYIVFYLTRAGEGIKTSEALSHKLGLRQRTCLHFMNKVNIEKYNLYIRKRGIIDGIKPIKE
jgi:Transposase zinc-ribbon domain